MTHDSSHDSLLGLQLDEYRIEELLGQGGMARVYRGLDTRLNRHVAIKVIDAALRTDSEYAVRFEREAQAIAKLDHPNIVRLYRYGEAHGVLYMAMQYIEGVDLGFVLADYRMDNTFIEPEEATRLVHQIGDALDYVHRQEVIHRDIKPTNIMLDRQGHALVTDFGLALLTEIGTRGEIFGSPHYIAPEQAISSAGAVPQSDLYALGVILYEMFTGELPYDADNPMDIALLHMEANLTSPRELRASISPALNDVILKAMAREPEQRYPTGLALANALDQALHRSVTPIPPLITQRRLSVPERVALELDAHPLPPIPAEVTPVTGPPTRIASASPPITTPPPPTPPTYPRRKARLSMPIVLGLGIGAALLISALIVILYLLLGSSNDDTPVKITALVASDQTVIAQQQSATWTPFHTTTAILVDVSSATFSPMPTYTALVLPTHTVSASFTLTLQPSITPTETATPLPTSTPAPTITTAPLIMPTASFTPAATLTPTYAVEYELLLAKRKEDSLFVVNLSAAEFPLDSLSLGNDTGRVEGAEWGVNTLNSGECVAIWKDSGKPKAPKDLECNEVGEHLVRSGKERFWKSSFTIYFLDEEIATCDRNECTLIFAP